MRCYKMEPERWGPNGQASRDDDPSNSESDSDEVPVTSSGDYSWIAGQTLEELQKAQRADPQLA